MSEDRIICQPASLIGSPNSDTSLPTETGSTALIIFFLAGSLLLGAILREVSKKTRIPCSSLLIIVGTIIGYYLHRFGIFADAVQEFLQIGPYGIMLIFIPTLVFESAFCTDWYIVKKVMKNIFVLAVPGVLLNSFLLAFTLKVILFYDDDHLTWPQALALSSLVSATDPIAIMSLLKNLGTPSKFNLLLIGESLMNNGMALVFFTLFMGISKEITKAPREVFLNFLQLAGGGPLLGCVVGILCSLWLRRITRDNILSITITFIACYLLFFAAETQLYVSGILAIVALGLFMSAYGKNKIDTKTEGTLGSVWAWVQHASETLIFILAGLMIGYEIVLNSESTIEIYDLYKMLIFYGFMILARIIMIAACYPFIRRHGYGINGKEYFALIWCGLKGVIALSLALAANLDESLPRRMRDLILLYLGGMCVLSFLVNETTSHWLVERMEMLIEPEIKSTLHKKLIAGMVRKAQEKTERLAENKHLVLADWNTVKQLTTLDELAVEDGENKKDQGAEMEDLTKIVQRRSAYQFFKDDDVYQETRFKLLRIMKGIFWQKYEQGTLSGEAARLLVQGVNVCLDVTEQPIDLWSFLYEYFNSFTLIKFLMKIKDFFLIGRVFRRYITNHVSFVYGITTSFIDVCGDLLESEDTIPSNDQYVMTIMEEIEKIRSDAENYILDLQGNFLEIVQTIQVHRAATQILGQQKYFLEEMLYTGQIEEREYSDLTRRVDRKLNSLDNFKIEWHLPNFNEFLLQFPIFNGLTNEDLRDMQIDSEQRVFHKGDYLYEVGWPCDGLFIITKGRVIESVDARKTFSRGVGTILSFLNIVNEQRKTMTTCEAFTDVQTTFVPYDKIDAILKRNEVFEERVYKNVCCTYLLTFPHKDDNNLKLEETKIKDMMRKAKLLTYREGEKFRLRNGGFLFTGAVTRTENKPQQNEKEKEKSKPSHFSIIGPSRVELVAIKRSKILVFSQESRDLLASDDDNRSERMPSIVEPQVKKSTKMSFKEAFQRDMFDMEFRNMMGRNKYEDFLS